MSFNAIRENEILAKISEFTFLTNVITGLRRSFTNAQSLLKNIIRDHLWRKSGTTRKCFYDCKSSPSPKTCHSEVFKDSLCRIIMWSLKDSILMKNCMLILVLRCRCTCMYILSNETDQNSSSAI